MLPLAAMMAVSTAMNMGASLLGGYEQYQALGRKQKDEEFAAFQAEKRGKQTQEALLERGRYVEGTARAQIAAEGFDFNTGTGAVLLNEIVSNSQNDAMAALLEGQTTAIQHRLNAQMAKISKKSVVINTLLSMGSQAASGASNIQSAKIKGIA